MLSSKTLNTKSCAVIALMVMAMGLSACGYRPLYAQNGTSAATTHQMARVNIKPIPDRVGQMLRTALKRRIAPKALNVLKTYQFTITLNESIATLAVEESAFATRANLNLQASYSLVRQADGLELMDGSLKTVSSYNILSSDFATISAKNDARKRAVKLLSAALQTRLAVYFKGPGAAQPKLKTNTGLR